jgi:hypothetical protein
LKNYHAVTDRLNNIHIVTRQHDGHVLLVGETLDLRAKIECRLYVESKSWLVEKNYVYVSGERTRERDFLFHAR